MSTFTAIEIAKVYSGSINHTSAGKWAVAYRLRRRIEEYCDDIELAPC
jgi:hypothetical protein